MRDLFQLLETVAATSSTVLITGETGTGKELAARAIHHNSPRRAQRFRRDQLQRDPRDAARGASSSATCAARSPARSPRGRAGSSRRTRARSSSTKSATMSPALQAKLLRVLQEREFERVGDSHTIKIDVRVIAATHSDLAQMVADGYVPRGSLLPAERHPGAAAAAARTPRRYPAAGAALPAEAVAPISGRGPVTMSQEAHAAAHGVSLARQRPAARERRRARDRLQPGPAADRSPGSVAGGFRTSRPPEAPQSVVSRRRHRLRAVHRKHRAVADQAIARAHQRQQAAGGEAAEPEANDAHRKVEAPRTAAPKPIESHH